MAKFKHKKIEIDMDATNEIFRRMDALEKRVADLTKEVRDVKVKKTPPPKSKTLKKD